MRIRARQLEARARRTVPAPSRVVRLGEPPIVIDSTTGQAIERATPAHGQLAAGRPVGRDQPQHRQENIVIIGLIIAVVVVVYGVLHAGHRGARRRGERGIIASTGTAVPGART